jgi:hypothetical protein
MPAVDVELEPEPPGDEREAILRAIEQADGEALGGRSAWWRAGVREALAAGADAEDGR